VFDEVAERDVVSCYSIIGVYKFNGENHGAGLVSLASQFCLSCGCACSLALLLAAACWLAASLCFALLCYLLPVLLACIALLRAVLIDAAAAVANLCSYGRLCCRCCPSCELVRRCAKTPLRHGAPVLRFGSQPSWVLGRPNTARDEQWNLFFFIDFYSNQFKVQTLNSIEICLNLESGQIFLWNLSLNVTYRIKI
jgi:hypothetical protein